MGDPIEYRCSTEERYLRDLLAVIHRDGGHHTTEVGLEQSTEDARVEVSSLRGSSNGS